METDQVLDGIIGPMNQPWNLLFLVFLLNEINAYGGQLIIGNRKPKKWEEPWAPWETVWLAEWE